ncbi:MAG: hypothetical protein ACRDPF_14235, partial [Streptosporangiaceae bacterium]
MSTDLFHCHLLGQSLGPAQVIARARRLGEWFFEGRYGPAPRWGVTQKCACRWNLSAAGLLALSCP